MLRILKHRKLLLSWTSITRTGELRLASTVLKTGPAFNDSSNPWERESVVDSVMRLEEEVVKNRKISKHYLENLLNFPNVNISNQMILSLLPCFGQMAFADPPEVRIDYTNKVWNKLKASGVKLNIGHYNELLRVYLENDYDFSPSKILEEMKEYNIKPNRVTYRYMLRRFCKEGDLSAVSSLLKEMKEESILFNESIFNELILGHCIAKDVDGANNIMKIMKERNLEIGSSTYAAFLCGLAISGDIENFNSFLGKCSEDKILLNSEQLFDITYNLVMNGHTAVALELINNYTSALDKSLVKLFLRLLNRKQYDSCLQISKILSTKDVETGQAENLIWRAIAENESFKNMKKIVNDWEQKGYSSDIMEQILFYTLKDEDLFKKSLRILKDFRDTGKTVKEIYFWPIVAAAIQKNSANDIIEILRIMKYDFNIYITKTFLHKNIFNNLLNEQTTELVMVGLRKIRLTRRHVRNAFLLSCLEKQRVNEVFKNSQFLYIPKDLGKVNAFLVNCSEARSAPLVVDLLKNVCESTVKNPHNGEEFIILSTDMGKTTMAKMIQDAVDSIVIYLAEHTFPSKNIFLKNLYEEMLSSAIPISKTAGDFIKKRINDPGLEYLIDDLTELPPIDVSKYLMHKNDQTDHKGSLDIENVYQFLNYCNLGKIDEAENLFKEHPSIQENYFEKFIVTLKKAMEEEKVNEYIKQLANKIREGEIKQTTIFLQKELLQKGYMSEVFTLWRKLGKIGKLSYERKMIKKILSNFLDEASLENIVHLVESGNDEIGVITAGEIVFCYAKKKNLEKIFNFFEKSDVKNFRNMELGRNLIFPLICEGETDMLKKIVAFLETKIPFSSVGPDLLLAYTCLGDIEKARDCLEKEKLRTFKTFLLIKEIGIGKIRMEILENVINVLKGRKETGIQAILYELLMEDYEKHKVDPNRGLALWEQMQEFHIVPTAPFMGYLARLLKANNMPIPFDDSNFDQEEWLLESDIPRPILRDLLDQLQRGEAEGLSLVIEEGIKTGSIRTNMIQRLLEGIELKEDKRELKNVCKKNLRYCLSLAEYKRAFNERRLLKYVKSITNSSDPDVIMDNIPHSFLVDCLMRERFDRLPNEVATVIMWACCNVVFPDIELAKIYEEKVQNSIADRTVLEGVLKFAPYLTPKKRIINFLVSKEIFADVGLDKEVKYVSNMANKSTKANQIDWTNEGPSEAFKPSSENKSRRIDNEVTENTYNRQEMTEVAPEPTANEVNSEEEAKAVPSSSGSV